MLSPVINQLIMIACTLMWAQAGDGSKVFLSIQSSCELWPIVKQPLDTCRLGALHSATFASSLLAMLFLEVLICRLQGLGTHCTQHILNTATRTHTRILLAE